MTIHYKRLIGDKVKDALAPLVGTWQSQKPGALLPSAWVTVRAAEALTVSQGAVRKYLTDAVADGVLLEILTRRDWLVVLPSPKRLPPLYAVLDGEVYKLARERPDSRGSNNISFLTTPEGFNAFLLRAEKDFPMRK